MRPLYCQVPRCHFASANLDELTAHLYEHKEKRKMNNQMEQVWRSKDGKCVGSQAEVEAYLATLSPLGKMRFPYYTSQEYVFHGEVPYQIKINNKELKALVAFANLAPLIQEALEDWDATDSGWRTREWSVLTPPTVTLLLAYEEALKLVPR